MIKNSSHSRIASIGFSVAIAAGVAAALSGFGTRWRWWDFRTGLVILRWAASGGMVSAVLLLGCVLAGSRGTRRDFTLAVAGLVTSLAVVAIPLSWMLTAKRVPPIHDITTDTLNPPRFAAVLALRKDAPNPAEYGGPEIAAKQQSAYPGLKPLFLPLPPERAFDLALAATKQLGWEIDIADRAEARIEATDTTFWFGFKDDIVVRITPEDGGSRIDLRSVSRVGRSDVGTNAKRIRRYLEKLVVLQKGYQKK